MKYPLRNEDGIYYNVALKSYADIIVKCDALILIGRFPIGSEL